MTFQPILPNTGYSGWIFLDRTMETQQETFSKGQAIVRDTDYFAQNIGAISTAEELVDDPRLLRVALGAYGLDDDVNSQFFIRKILEEGTTSDDALANRLSDSRYADFSAAFGLDGQTPPTTQTSGFAENIIARYEVRQFQQAVGEQDNDLRLAMSVQDGVSDILANNTTSDGQWYSILGNAPMRSVFQTALGLPESSSSIDLERQLEIFQTRAESMFGTDELADFAEPELQEKLIRMFLIRSEAANIASFSGSSTALTLLQSTSSFY
ncbi:DUF1217 domain-containing protein [Yoonia sp. I 8.24]|uniref:DUF1217 domain-containing protein n=1 Tax=Yoonia sp. I 8.24 TaxID=1537229 RepID=UPI001EDF7EBD|nr:DUF1217 domain-containing protein [Yoonia sp. I 8.24]MCG3269114.1 DUF1217 domain-containing protein [Yoonia sp. I 8.24]